MKSRSFRKSYRVKRRKPILKSRFFGFGVLFLAVAAGVFYLVCFAPFSQVKNIIITGSNKVQAVAVKKTVENAVTRKIAFLSSKSILLANSSEITADLLENFPQIEKISLRKSFPDKLSVSVSERQPVAVFSQGGNYFLMDKNGVIFSQVATPQNNMIIFQNDLATSSAGLGQTAVPVDVISWTLQAETVLQKDFSLGIKEADLVSNQRLNLKTAEGWEVYFNLNGDMGWQITELETVLNEKIPSQKRSNLQYIDLRFDKVYIYPQIS